MKASRPTILMYKDCNGYFVVIHNDHVIIRTRNLLRADMAYITKGGK